jgi:hypothetical protein
MSYRSTLLATTMGLALAAAAAIDPVSAHGGGGGFGGGGSFHVSGPSSIAHAPTFAPTHLGTSAGSVSVNRSVFATTKVLSQPGNVSLSSKVAMPSTVVTGGGMVLNPGIGGKVIVQKNLSSTVSALPNVGSTALQIQPPALSSKSSVPPNVFGTGNKVPVPPLQGPGSTTPPAPLPALPEAPKHSTGSFGGIAVSVLGNTAPIVDGDCYLVKRKFATPDGDIIRRVKVCEVLDADQSE